MKPLTLSIDTLLNVAGRNSLGISKNVLSNFMWGPSINSTSLPNCTENESPGGLQQVFTIASAFGVISTAANFPNRALIGFSSLSIKASNNPEKSFLNSSISSQHSEFIISTSEGVEL